jgi:hypothetical protein
MQLLLHAREVSRHQNTPGTPRERRNQDPELPEFIQQLRGPA